MISCHDWQHHYRQAEQLLEQAHEVIDKRRLLSDTDRAIIDLARVHALMASIRAEPSVVDKLKME